MKIKCYCIYCPNHPLYSKRNEIDPPQLNEIWSEKAQKAAADVNCFKPDSGVFNEFDIEPSDLSYEEIAYSDGCGEWNISGQGYEIFGVCSNEKYEE